MRMCKNCYVEKAALNMTVCKQCERERIERVQYDLQKKREKRINPKGERL